MQFLSDQSFFLRKGFWIGLLLGIFFSQAALKQGWADASKPTTTGNSIGGITVTAPTFSIGTFSMSPNLCAVTSAVSDTVNLGLQHGATRSMSASTPTSNLIVSQLIPQASVANCPLNGGIGTPCGNAEYGMGGGMGSMGGMGMMGGMGGMGMMGGMGGMGMMGGMGGMGMGMGGDSCPSPETVQIQQAQMHLALCAASCRKSQLSSIQAELMCMSQTDQLLNTQLQGLSSQAVKFVQKVNESVLKLENKVTDFTTKKTTLEQQLKALQAVANPLKTAVEKMSPEISTLKTAVTLAQGKKDALHAKVEQTKTAKTMDCFFTQKRSNLHCGTIGPSNPNPGPVSTAEYLECQINNQLKAASRNQTTLAQGKRDSANLSSILDLMKQDSPTLDSAKGASETSSYLTVQDLENRYKTQIGDSHVGNNAIWPLVKGTLDYCNSRAELEVEQELGAGNSPLYQAQLEVTTANNQNIAQVNQLLSTYQTEYQEGVNAVNQSDTAGLNIDSCIVSPTSQRVEADMKHALGCLKDEFDKMQILMHDKVFKKSIPGTEGKALTFECKGLLGCEAEEIHQSTLLQANISTIKTAETKYIQEANNSLYTGLKNVEQQVAARDMLNKARATQLMSGLSLLGVSPKQIPNVPPENWTCNPDPQPKAVCPAPNNLVRVISQMEGGTHPDLEALATSMGDSINTKISEAYQKMGFLTMQETTLTDQMESCQRRRLSDKVQDLSEAEVSGCSDFCNSMTKSQVDRTLSDASQALQNIRGRMTRGRGTISELDSGLNYKTFCHGGNPTGGSVVMDNYSECRRYYSRLKGLKSLEDETTLSSGGRGMATGAQFGF